MVVLAIVGLLAMVALPAYQDYTDRLDMSTAVTDIKAMEVVIVDYNLSNGQLPSSLADIGMAGKTDPWGNPYQYSNHDTAKSG